MSNRINASLVPYMPTVSDYLWHRGDIIEWSIDIDDDIFNSVGVIENLENAFYEYGKLINLSFVQKDYIADIHITTGFGDAIEGGSVNPLRPSEPLGRGNVLIEISPNLLLSEVGEVGYAVMLHEIGHALFLDHPQGWAESSSHQYTIMSYNGHPGVSVDSSKFFGEGHYPQSPMIADIIKLQELYGVDLNTTANDDIYYFSELVEEREAGPIVKTIFDAGGIDTIDASKQLMNALIDLRPGHFSSIGPFGSQFHGQRAEHNVAIVALDDEGQNTVISGRPADPRFLIENAIGGHGNDTIYGNEASNRLEGGPGFDSLYGGDGDDVYVIDVRHEGWDTIVDEQGVNRIELAGTPRDVRADHSGGSLRLSNDGIQIAEIAGFVAAAWDGVLVDGELLSFDRLLDTTLRPTRDNPNVVGTEGNDVIEGDARANRLRGFGGDDIITGGPGDDDMDGGEGSDRYLIGPGHGANRIVDTGKEGFDVIEATASGTAIGLRSLGGIERIASGGHSGVTIEVFSDRPDSNYVFDFSKVELVDIAAIHGRSKVNDFIIGSAGHDVIRGFSGNDLLRGGPGNDTIYGGPGNDTLEGNDGNDKLYGGPGNDRLIGGPGRNILDGGDDVDTVALTVPGLTAGVFADLAFNPDHGIAYDRQSNGGVFYNTIYNIENIEGTSLRFGGGDDILYGDDRDNVIYGRSGNDFLDGRGGNDTLYGGPGNDRLFGGEGDDKLYGGPGDDRLYGGPGENWLYGGTGNDTVGYDVQLPALTEGVLVDLANNRAEDKQSGGKLLLDHIIEVENVIGSVFDDTIIGDKNDNILAGGFGNDILTGGLGSDTFRYAIDRNAGLAGFDEDVVHDGRDTITDFQRNTDKLLLQGTVGTGLFDFDLLDTHRDGTINEKDAFASLIEIDGVESLRLDIGLATDTSDPFTTLGPGVATIDLVGVSSLVEATVISGSNEVFLT